MAPLVLSLLIRVIRGRALLISGNGGRSGCFCHRWRCAGWGSCRCVTAPRGGAGLCQPLQCPSFPFSL